MAPAPTPSTIQVTVPAGAQQGQQLQFTLPDGRTVQAAAAGPPGTKMRLEVAAAAAVALA